MTKRKSAKSANAAKVGSLDFETDPFKFDRVPFPFAGCVYFGPTDYQTFWGKKTPYLTAEYLRELPKCKLYVHNGGKFDFHWLLEFAEPGTVIIRNGRIVRFKIGRVTLEDSFPLMPFPLAAYQKTEINYDLFEEDKREGNREQIINYMVDDCRDLLQLVTGFKSVVGPKDTIGGAAFHQMRQIGYKIEKCGESHDDRFRPYYYGGRVQAFNRGIFRGPFQFLDINSAYPFAMLHEHPHGASYRQNRKLPKRKHAYFASIVATSRGALPYRADETLEFPDDNEAREYNATGWEIAAGLETGTLKIHKVLNVFVPEKTISFDTYVKTFFAKRNDAKQAKDKIGDLAYKYLLNSGYGKFATNPRDWKEYCLAIYGEDMPGWDYEADYGGLTLWSKSSYRGGGFYDVATGASITGFVRAMLWRAICASNGVFYCDTDSLICRASAAKIGPELGNWKIEGTAQEIAIAGKKLYGVYWDEPFWTKIKRMGKEIVIKHKTASKGARLDYNDIKALCRGEVVKWQNDAPTFNINTGARFVTREIKAT